MRKFINRNKAEDYAIWQNFLNRTKVERLGVVETDTQEFRMVSSGISRMVNQKSIPLRESYGDMEFEEIQTISKDDDPLPHWEAIQGMFAITDGEILRFILQYQVPLEKFIRVELAHRGYDEDLHWVGFSKAEKIWITDDAFL